MRNLLKPFGLMLVTLTTSLGLWAAEASSDVQTTTVEKVQAARGPITAEAEVKHDTVTVISPRTGIRYTLGNTGNRQIILQTPAIVPANSANINRIVATNPAISSTSQEKAKIALIGAEAVQAANAAQVQSAAVVPVAPQN